MKEEKQIKFLAVMSDVVSYGCLIVIGFKYGPLMALLLLGVMFGLGLRLYSQMLREVHKQFLNKVYDKKRTSNSDGAIDKKDNDSQSKKY